MKKWICLFGAVISCLFFTISAQADVIFEPDDSFYRAHASDCTHVERQFIANGPDGKVIVYESPESPKTVDTWENGQQKTIYFTYEDKDGVVWGVCKNGGWMPMEYMEVVYDHISFMEEHESEIKSQGGTLEGQQKGETVYFWKYPGSEVAYEAYIEDQPPTYDYVYVDGEGRNWGCIGYYYGHRDAWVCIDQPMADYGQLYPQGAPQGNGQDEENENDSKGTQIPEGQEIAAQDSENQEIGTQDSEGQKVGEADSEIQEIGEQDSESQSLDGQDLEGQSLDGQNSEGQENGKQQTEAGSDRIKPKVNNSLVAWAVALVGIVAVVTIVLLAVLKKRRK